MPSERGRPADGMPAGTAIHATAVAIGGRGLLIVGASRAGKSRLACALIAASTPRCPIRLIGDDRILLLEIGSGLSARPHPRTAGFIERRGLGLVAASFVASAPVSGVVVLGSTTAIPELVQNFPCRTFVESDGRGAATLGNDVLSWWRGVGTTHAMKSRPTGGRGAKD